MSRLAPIFILFVSLSGCLSGELQSGFDGETNGSPVDGKGNTFDTLSTCGDGLISGAETCDGSCPTSCDDQNTCTSDVLNGSAEGCDAECVNQDITTCVDGDGCCPDVCDGAGDSDCSDSCGDGVVDAEETCDGNCPTECDDGNACTTSRLTGSPDRCNVQCSTTPVTACVDADGCCPSGCEADTDSDCGAVCGNGEVEGIEICDGDCPDTCDDGLACTRDTLRGAAATCDAQCAFIAITQCVGGDGCCPSSCNEVNDSDCMPLCGNDVVETGETCDGACPDCNDGVACTADAMTGSAATCNVVCENTAITACVDGDGCCAPGCDTTNDDDCNAVCGNGVIEGGETCDPIADCPTACDDMDACTADTLVGDAQTCDAVCLYAAITACVDDDGCCPNGCDANTDNDCAAMCGNAITEPGETCDPESSCPMNTADCDDQNACTGDTFGGDPATCTAMCTYNDVTACISGDGCCPTSCTPANDTDCVAQCGNGVVEMGETCDPIADCPTDCDDMDACTSDTLTGSPTNCTAACQNVEITMCVDGDGCCPAACDETTDDDCNASCGNGVLETGETCDPIADCPTSCDDMDACTTDELLGSASNCTAECQYTDITTCIDGDGCCPMGCNANDDDDCAPICGNDVVEPGETCDPMADCPAPADCNDQDDCTIDTHSGSVMACDAECSYAVITACVDGDGCCPSGCDFTDDDDCPVVIDCTNPASWPTGWASLEVAIFNETNARRTSPQTCNNTSYPAAPALVSDDNLVESARCHAIDMASNNFFSHTGSDGSTPFQRMTAAGYNYNTAAENIAAGNSQAAAIVNQWMNSTSGHCEAIMNPNYEDLGVGYAFDQDSTYDHYSVQNFGRD